MHDLVKLKKKNIRITDFLLTYTCTFYMNTYRKS